MNRYESTLDVKNLIETSLNVQIYLSLVLSHSQKLLFKHHKDRAVTLPEIKANSDETCDSIFKLSYNYSDAKINELLDGIYLTDDLDRKLLLGVLPHKRHEK